jgi:hypothetical protein
MKSLKVDIPDNLELTEHDIKMIVAGRLYQTGKLTLGQAGGLGGISKRVFIETMGLYGFSIFSESVNDFRKDFRIG